MVVETPTLVVSTDLLQENKFYNPERRNNFIICIIKKENFIKKIFLSVWLKRNLGGKIQN